MGAAGIFSGKTRESVQSPEKNQNPPDPDLQNAKMTLFFKVQFVQEIKDMDVKKEFYGDGLTQLHFVGGLVRCDFATLQPNTAGTGEAPIPEKSLRLVMPLPGFLKTYDTMKALLDRMLDAGIVKKNLIEKLDD